MYADDASKSPYEFSGASFAIGNANVSAEKLSGSGSVSIAGNYKMSLDAYARVADETWTIPLQVKITQNGTTIIDEVMNTKGYYRVYDTASTTEYTETKCTANVTDGGLRFTSKWGPTIHRYNWINSIALEKGSFDIEISPLGYGGNRTDANYAIDVMKFVRVNETQETEEPFSTVTIEDNDSSVVYGPNNYNEAVKEGEADGVNDAGKFSGGTYTLIKPKNIGEAALTYKSKIGADGPYTLNMDMWIDVNNKSYASPVAVTIKQGDVTIVDNMPIAAADSYTTYTKAEDGTINNATVECVPTVKNGEKVYTSRWGNAVYRYEWLNKLELTKGDIEISFAALSLKADASEILFGLDVINLVRDKDYENIKIDAASDEIEANKTMQLAAKDQYNSLFENDDTATVIWESSNANIFTIDENGLLTAKNPGVATVTLDVNGVQAKKDIKVYASDAKIVVNSVKLDGSNVVVEYVAKGNLDENGVTFIAGRYTSESGALAETKAVKLEGNEPYMIRTERITLDGTDGPIKLFTWVDLNNIKPIFSAFDVK